MISYFQNDKHKQCLITFKNNIQIILETKASLNEITKWSEDFLRCIYNSIPTNCPTATKEVFIFRELLAVPEKQTNSTLTSLNITKIIKQKLPSQNVKGFAQSKRTTSSIHGIEYSSYCIPIGKSMIDSSTKFFLFLYFR